MHKLIAGVLIFMAGLGLGWYAHTQWGTDPRHAEQPVVPASAEPASPEAPAASGRMGNLVELLQRNEFEAVVQRYEVLQGQAGETAAADARTRILAHARALIAERQFGLAEQLLQMFLVTGYRDVEARIQLAAAYRGQENFVGAIDQLYEARGYAFRPAMLQEITGRIRSMVAVRSQSLEHANDQEGLLALYQHLTQLEPDHAPWFLGLAAAQWALDDREAARRSLLLVIQDPEIGAQAQTLLAQLDLAGMQDTAPRVAGIPLHRSGNHFIVDARPAQGRSIRLLIDTGASLTILTPAVLEQRGIPFENTGKTGVFNTANGPIQGPVYKLDSLSVGDWQVSDLEVGVLELDGSAEIDGLLGMNFLNQFQFYIDQNAALLRLSEN